jgi:quercetin dioxygenase-like cupin family protein
MKIIQIDDLNNESVSHDTDVEKKVILRNSEVPHIMQMAQATLTRGQITSKHQHPDMTEIYHVVSGTGEMEINENKFIIKQGMCIVVQPGEYHEVRNQSDENLVLVYFGVKD